MTIYRYKGRLFQIRSTAKPNPQSQLPLAVAGIGVVAVSGAAAYYLYKNGSFGGGGGGSATMCVTDYTGTCQSAYAALSNGQTIESTITVPSTTIPVSVQNVYSSANTPSPVVSWNVDTDGYSKTIDIQTMSPGWQPVYAWSVVKFADGSTAKTNSVLVSYTAAGGSSSSSSNTCTGTCTESNGQPAAECNGCGAGHWLCNEGVCYLPTVGTVTQALTAVEIATYGYRSDYCCEYGVDATTHNCGWCGAGNCGTNNPSGSSSYAILTVYDQFGNPASNVTVNWSASANTVGSGLVKISNTTTTTDSKGVTSNLISVTSPPSPYDQLGSYPACADIGTDPLGIPYCSGGSGYSKQLLTSAGIPVGQVNWTIPQTTFAGAFYVGALVYGSCTYLGSNINQGGCSCT
jgi:hypothetical protein